MTMLVFDQTVTVYDPTTEETHKGRIITIGKDKVTIAYDGRTGTFRKNDQRLDDGFGLVQFRTLDQAAADQTFAEIDAVLQRHGLTITPGHEVSVETLRRVINLLEQQA